MKGITKAIKRTPHLVTSKVGISKKSTDPEFDELHLNFTSMEGTVEKMLKDCKTFNDGVVSLFSSGTTFAAHLSTLFHPIAGEYDLIGSHPTSADTIRNIDTYNGSLEELRAIIVPELELIERRIIAPTKELQVIMKQIRKTITKRDHKLVDYDRYNNSLTKLRDKKEKTLNDEKNLFKIEQDYEAASNDYENINAALKSDMPQFMILATQFIDPLFKSFFYMQLNIFYTMIQTMNTFIEGKYDYAVITAQITGDYEDKRVEAQHELDNLMITKRILSTAKLVSQGRSVSGSSFASASPTLSPPATATSRNGPIPLSPSFTSSNFKSPPPPPSPGSSFANAASTSARSPPPYSAGTATGFGAGASSSTFGSAAEKKRAPPPPPLKSKPKAEPPVQYVTAVYDFAPQADGDLGFSAGDRIEVVQKTNSAEDWWTGRFNGKQGVFPANYVQES